MNHIAQINNIQPSELIKATPIEIAEQSKKDLARQAVIATNLLVITDHVFTDANNAFAGYVDDEGVKASSPGGFKTSINKRIKDAYGTPREAMPTAMRMHCNLAYQLMADAIHQGIATGISRKQIKRQVTEIINVMSEQWAQIETVFTGGRA